jgi:hypothetical protein
VHVLNPEDFRSYVERFNAEDGEDVINLIPNARAWEWMKGNVPLFECPDRWLEEVYYYRWWTYRKHLKRTPAGRIVTEFITPVRHAGAYNSISCALGHHLAEGRWLREQGFLDEYVRFWFRADGGRPEVKFHQYSSWLAAAWYERWKVTGDTASLLELLDDLIADYERWEAEKLRADGLFWQHDVWDGMEESISGSRRHRNARPTINSYMYGNARAIAEMVRMGGSAGLRPAAILGEVAERFNGKAEGLKRLVQDKLWDAEAGFFKAQTEEDGLSDAREAIGFIPWCFRLPDPGYEEAWAQLIDPDGFWAPCGITTAERRHPRFRSHGVGQCEWDGAVWPFATSQTLEALANVLRYYDQGYVTKQHYFDAVRTYAQLQRWGERPYVGEYHDEVTGEWLKGDNPRSRFYNHSTFCDLVISGLVGLVPRADETIEVNPLLPGDAWDWFCLNGVRYRGRTVTVVWDRDGSRYGQGAGLSVLVDGKRVGHSVELERLTAELAGPGEISSVR